MGLSLPLESLEQAYGTVITNQSPMTRDTPTRACLPQKMSEGVDAGCTSRTLISHLAGHFSYVVTATRSLTDTLPSSHFLHLLVRYTVKNARKYM